MTKAAPMTPEIALLTALAADPNVGPALDALKAATDRFNAIRAKLNDETIEASATKREADARTGLVRAQALSEIGTATADQVAAARLEHTAASEALQGIAGRDEVLAEELRKVQSQISEHHDALTEAFNKWRAAALDAAKAAAAEGVRLVQLAALAADGINVGWGFVPRHTRDIGQWLTVNDVQFTRQDRPAMASIASETVRLLDRTTALKSEEIRAPRRSAPATQATRPAPSSPAPGIPHSLTHDALGNVLPEARKILAQQKAARSAPYDDGRDGAQEIPN